MSRPDIDYGDDSSEGTNHDLSLKMWTEIDSGASRLTTRSTTSHAAISSEEQPRSKEDQPRKAESEAEGAHRPIDRQKPAEGDRRTEEERRVAAKLADVRQVVTPELQKALTQEKMTPPWNHDNHREVTTTGGQKADVYATGDPHVWAVRSGKELYLIDSKNKSNDVVLPFDGKNLSKLQPSHSSLLNDAHEVDRRLHEAQTAFERQVTIVRGPRDAKNKYVDEAHAIAELRHKGGEYSDNQYVSHLRYHSHLHDSLGNENRSNALIKQALEFSTDKFGEHSDQTVETRNRAIWRGLGGKLVEQQAESLKKMEESGRGLNEAAIFARRTLREQYDRKGDNAAVKDLDERAYALVLKSPADAEGRGSVSAVRLELIDTFVKSGKKEAAGKLVQQIQDAYDASAKEDPHSIKTDNYRPELAARYIQIGQPKKAEAVLDEGLATAKNWASSTESDPRSMTRHFLKISKQYANAGAKEKSSLSIKEADAFLNSKEETKKYSPSEIAGARTEFLTFVPDRAKEPAVADALAHMVKSFERANDTKLSEDERLRLTQMRRSAIESLSNSEDAADTRKQLLAHEEKNYAAAKDDPKRASEAVSVREYLKGQYRASGDDKKLESLFDDQAKALKHSVNLTAYDEVMRGYLALKLPAKALGIFESADKMLLQQTRDGKPILSVTSQRAELLHHLPDSFYKHPSVQLSIQRMVNALKESGQNDPDNKSLLHRAALTAGLLSTLSNKPLTATLQHALSEQLAKDFERCCSDPKTSQRSDVLGDNLFRYYLRNKQNSKAEAVVDKLVPVFDKPDMNGDKLANAVGDYTDAAAKYVQLGKQQKADALIEKVTTTAEKLAADGAISARVRAAIMSSLIDVPESMFKRPAINVAMTAMVKAFANADKGEMNAEQRRDLYRRRAEAIRSLENKPNAGVFREALLEQQVAHVSKLPQPKDHEREVLHLRKQIREIRDSRRK